MSQLQVQDSSDCCINSKYSSACKGYFQDDYINLFTKKLLQRSPIINRGYYIRFKAMEEVFQSWTSNINPYMYSKFQIISLGAGYDSSFLRLRKNNKLPPNCHFIEIDFCEVLRKKLKFIYTVLSSEYDLLQNSVTQDPFIILHTAEYSLLGIDMTNVSSLQEHLDQIGISYNVPTLFFSECSITYIEPQSSENLISWIQNFFPNASFVTYEQIYPDDAFGLVMQNHFVQVGCPLKSIAKYSTEEVQCERFKNLGWSTCVTVNMFDFFESLPVEEKHRLQELEMFDEYEMWHEKCLHYVLVWASQGVLSPSPLFLALASSQRMEVTTSAQKCFSCKKYLSQDIVHRFGHQALPFSSTSCLVSGGFGVLNKRHQRLGDIVLYDIKSMQHSNATLVIKEHLIGNRMFHTLTKLSNGVFVLLGGRTSPSKVFEDVLILEQTQNGILDPEQGTVTQNVSFVIKSKGSCMPVPSWRHSASVVHVQGCEYIIVFGGRSLDAIATNGCFALNTNTWKWSNIEKQHDTPIACHSHSAVTYKENSVIVSGGLSADEQVLHSVHQLDCKSWKWTLLNISGLLPRYSHTSHIWNDHLLLVGGVTSLSNWKLGVGVVDLSTLLAMEIQPPAQDPEYPILLCNHASYLYEDKIFIVGGGGNCFSFGTHFNKNIVVIDCKCLI